MSYQAAENPIELMDKEAYPSYLTPLDPDIMELPDTDTSSPGNLYPTVSDSVKLKDYNHLFPNDKESDNLVHTDHDYERPKDIVYQTPSDNEYLTPTDLEYQSPSHLDDLNRYELMSVSEYGDRDEYQRPKGRQSPIKFTEGELTQRRLRLCLVVIVVALVLTGGVVGSFFVWQYIAKGTQGQTTVTNTTSTTNTNVTEGKSDLSNIEGVCPGLPRYVRTLPGGVKVVMYSESVFNVTWVVFQRRVSGDVSFYRPWNDYVTGFGQFTDSFWLGLETIHQMCNKATKCELLVHLQYPLEPADVPHRPDGCYFARYSEFWLDSADNKYSERTSGYSGTAGDSFVESGSRGGQPFSTFDQDNDKASSNCAVSWHGAWWYKSCSKSNLNGGWGRRGASGMVWRSLTGWTNSVTFSEMKLRRLT